MIDQQQQQKDDNPVIRFEQASDALPFMRSFTSKGIRSLDIFSHALHPSLYNDQDLMDAIVTLAGYSPRSKIRILVRNSNPLLSTQSPLINLSQRIPSKVKLRVYTEGAKDRDMGFFCIDKKHLIYFNNEPSFQGFTRTNAKHESKRVLDEFEHLWIYGSKEDPNLRQLSI